MTTVQTLDLILIIVVGIILLLGIIVAFLFLRNKGDGKDSKKNADNKADGSKKSESGAYTKDGKPIESIYKFMEFEEIKDNMIIRKNGKQYIMVIECHGINYDLLSEDEKISVEEGFVQFLNAISFPVQLYLQTRSLNMNDILDQYNVRIDRVRDEINKLDTQIQAAKAKGNKDLVDRLTFDRRKKLNILEYGEDIAEYSARMNQNRNVLQQKTYIIVSYFSSELGDIGNYSKDEIIDMCFSELYTRCQTLIRSLASASVYGKTLDSEALVELLYVAYNRDDADRYQFSKALDANYDNLYSTAKDVLEKKQEKLEKEIYDEATDLASDSLLTADKLVREKRKQLVKNKAVEIVNEYRDELDDELLEETKKQIREANGDKKKAAKEEKKEKPNNGKRAIRRPTM